MDGQGIPLVSVIAPAGRHESPLLEPTLGLLALYQPFPTPPTVHLDKGYAFLGTAARLVACGLIGEISPRGKPAPAPPPGRRSLPR